MKRIGQHRKQIVLVLVVLALAGILVASFLSLGSDTWLGRTAETVIAWVQKPFTAAGDAVHDMLYRISHAKELEAENALEAVAYGTGKSLENIDLLRRTAMHEGRKYY